METIKKAKFRTPWQARLWLYLATWPDDDFADHRIGLEFKVQRALKEGGAKHARAVARIEGKAWMHAAGYRVFRFVAVTLWRGAIAVVLRVLT